MLQTAPNLEFQLFKLTHSSDLQQVRGVGGRNLHPCCTRGTTRGVPEEANQYIQSISHGPTPGTVLAVLYLNVSRLVAAARLNPLNPTTVRSFDDSSKRIEGTRIKAR